MVGLYEYQLLTLKNSIDESAHGSAEALHWAAVRVVE